MRFLKWAVLVSAMAGAVGGLGQFEAQAEETTANFSFPWFLDPSSGRTFFFGKSPCPPTGTASAKINENQGKGTTAITIKVEQAKPNEFYGVWIRLKNESPLGTHIAATALAPTTAITQLLAITPPNLGSTDMINGFFTNAEGNGLLRVELDFLLSEGVYPFSRYDPALPNVPLLSANDASGGTLRIVAHCTDHLGHGLVPGTHEPSFDWALP